MEFALLGWPADAPRLRLDYRRFSYAGKFVTGSYGIAVVRGEPSDDHDASVDSIPDDHDAGSDPLPSLPEGLDESAFADGVLAAVAFNADRTDSRTLWLRYLTVRRDLRGSGRRLGPRLAVFATARAADQGYDRVRIAVNNAFSYQALSRAGFGFTGAETGLAEVVLERPAAEPAPISTADYQRGLDEFRQREGLSAAEDEFLASHADSEPPTPITEPLASTSEPPAPARGDSGVSNSQRPSE